MRRAERFLRRVEQGAGVDTGEADGAAERASDCGGAALDVQLQAAAEDDGARRPCCECLSMMASERYFRPDTEIISLFKDDDNGGRLAMRVQTVGDFLPLEAKKGPSLSKSPAQTLPVGNPPAAREVLRRSGLQDRDVENLMAAAQQEFAKGSVNDGLSGHSPAGRGAGFLRHGPQDLHVAAWSILRPAGSWARTS